MWKDNIMMLIVQIATKVQGMHHQEKLNKMIKSSTESKKAIAASSIHQGRVIAKITWNSQTAARTYTLYETVKGTMGIVIGKPLSFFSLFSFSVDMGEVWEYMSQRTFSHLRGFEQTSNQGCSSHSSRMISE